MTRPFSALRAAAAAVVLALCLACHANCSTGGDDVTAAVSGPLASRPADGQLPPAEAIQTGTPVIYIAWTHPGLQVGEQISARLVAVNVGAAAPPGTEVVRTQPYVVPSPGGNGSGNFSFTAPTNGWPPGRYRVEAFRGANVFANTEFDITNSNPQ